MILSNKIEYPGEKALIIIVSIPTTQGMESIGDYGFHFRLFTVKILVRKIHDLILTQFLSTDIRSKLLLPYVI
jgi:hypothetical protein